MLMAGKNPFPKLGDWDDTLETLHAYAKVLGAIREAYTPERPRFQHISLRMYTAGLTTTPIPHPKDANRNFSLSLDLRNHYVLLSTSEGEVKQIRISEGLSANQLFEKLKTELNGLGIKGKVKRKKFASDTPHTYALDEAERYFAALSHVSHLFEQFRMEIPGQKEPVQFWPHHFDLSFSLLGNKMVHTVDGNFPSEITFGFAPPDRGQPTSYFYVKPFPFEDTVIRYELPDGAVWHTAVWQGAMLPYASVADKKDAEERILKFLNAAYQAEKKLI